MKFLRATRHKPRRQPRPPFHALPLLSQKLTYRGLGFRRLVPQPDSMQRNIISEPNTKGPSRGGLSELPLAFLFMQPQNQGRDRRIRWS